MGVETADVEVTPLAGSDIIYDAEVITLSVLYEPNNQPRFEPGHKYEKNSNFDKVSYLSARLSNGALMSRTPNPFTWGWRCFPAVPCRS